MKRLWIAAVAGLASLALGVAAPVAAASNGRAAAPKASSVPALYTVKVAGHAAGGKQFTGHYAIQRFVAGKKAVYAVGTLTGVLKGRHFFRRITRYDVKMPASLTGAGSTPAARAAQASCSILHLVLGPINLNLLGLKITTNRIVVDITAVPGAGNLLGNLLCDLTNALNQGGALSQLTGSLQQLTATLTSLTSLLGGL